MVTIKTPSDLNQLQLNHSLYTPANTQQRALSRTPSRSISAMSR
jgi:hypothetical protein